MQLKFRTPVTKRKVIALMFCAAGQVVAGAFLLGMGVGYLVAYAIQGKSAFRYFGGTNAFVALTLSIGFGIVAIWIGQLLLRQAKPHLPPPWWEQQSLAPEQMTQVRRQLDRRRTWRLVAACGLILFVGGAVWTANDAPHGTLKTVSEVIGWVLIVVVIVGLVGWRRTSHRLKRMGAPA